LTLITALVPTGTGVVLQDAAATGGRLHRRCASRKPVGERWRSAVQLSHPGWRFTILFRDRICGALNRR